MTRPIPDQRASPIWPINQIVHKVQQPPWNRTLSPNCVKYKVPHTLSPSLGAGRGGQIRPSISYGVIVAAIHDSSHDRHGREGDREGRQRAS